MLTRDDAPFGLGDTVCELVRTLEARTRKANVTREQYIAGLVKGTYPPLRVKGALRVPIGTASDVPEVRVEDYFVTAVVEVTVTLSDGTPYPRRRRIRLAREKPLRPAATPPAGRKNQT